jgi:hypothetical protein
MADAKTIELPVELYYEICHFLNVIDPNYVDLSYEKILGSYHYHKKKAKELQQKLREHREET